MLEFDRLHHAYLFRVLAESVKRRPHAFWQRLLIAIKLDEAKSDAVFIERSDSLPLLYRDIGKPFDGCYRDRRRIEYWR